VRVHLDELTAIDRRRVGGPSSDSSGRNLALYAGLGLVVLVFVVAYGAMFLGSGDEASSAAVQPDATAQIHEHGQISVQYDGTVVAFEDPQYAERDECFHFHDYAADGVWHVHCEDVTIEYALETLGIDVTANAFSIDGREYSDADGDEISVTVDGEPVDPQEHVLEGVGSVDAAAEGTGETIEIVVQSGD